MKNTLITLGLLCSSLLAVPALAQNTPSSTTAPAGLYQALGETAGITRLVFMIHRATRAIDGTSTSRCGVVLEHRTLPT